MPYVLDAALDAKLNYIKNNATALHICSAEPTTFTQATSTYSLGSTTPSISGPSDAAGGGRELTVAAVSGATVSTAGTVAAWAIVSGSVLLATGPASGSVTTLWDLNSFKIRSPDAVSL